MGEKLYKFTFKKQKRSAWELYDMIDIKYRGKEVGYIQKRVGGVYTGSRHNKLY